MEASTFQQLIDAWYGPLYRFALSLARNGDDALDLTQQTFARWAEKGHTLRDNWSLAFWKDGSRACVLGVPVEPGKSPNINSFFRA